MFHGVIQKNNIGTVFLRHGVERQFPPRTTRTTSFSASRVFIQLVRNEEHKIRINLIYTRHYAHLTT